MKNHKLTEFAKELRRNQTDAEKLLWSRLNKKQLNGVKFRRQEPIGHYIVDLVCLKKKLIIEIDGGQHNDAEASEKDNKRTVWLEDNGFQVLRFWNNDVILNIEGVLEIIAEALQHHPHPDPLPSRERVLQNPGGRG